jgi:hypothetical protein
MSLPGQDRPIRLHASTSAVPPITSIRIIIPRVAVCQEQTLMMKADQKGL